MKPSISDFFTRSNTSANPWRTFDVGFKYPKGVAPPTQRFAGLFFYQSVACLDNELVDLLQKLRGQPAGIVFEGLKVVAHVIKGAMAQHLAEGVVLVHQFLQAVVVAVQIEPDHATHQNRPQRHAGASAGLAHLGRDLTFQQLDWTTRIAIFSHQNITISEPPISTFEREKGGLIAGFLMRIVNSIGRQFTREDSGQNPALGHDWAETMAQTAGFRKSSLRQKQWEPASLLGLEGFRSSTT